MNIKCKVMHRDAKLPRKYRVTDAGLNLYCCTPINIPPREIRGIRTGVAIDVPDGHVGIIWARSSTCMKGLQCFAGLWDPNYIGEIVINMFNFTAVEVEIKKHERFAQFLIVELSKDLHVSEVNKLLHRYKKK